MLEPLVGIRCVVAEFGIALAAARFTCRRKGHLWDSDRPKGGIHERDICWRCDAVRGES